MRVLIVDDEPRVVQGLMRSLFHLGWTIQTAHSGNEALNKLASSKGADVVISDMRMPGMDGAELLHHVRDLYPEAVRVVLSGHTEVEAAMRAVPVAHQFLSKPCKAEIIQSVVERAHQLLQLMQQPELRSLVGQISELPSVPRLYVELTEVIGRKHSSIADVAQVVEKDMAMSAKVLQLVNSSFFSQAREVTTVQQAVTRLGIEMMKSLALATQAFQVQTARGAAMRTFLEDQQRHALTVGAVARRLCDDRKLGDIAFMSGVLHDLGKVVLRVGVPDRYAEMSTAQRVAPSMPPLSVEVSTMGVSHATVGAYLVGLWGLPLTVVEAVAYHHQPSEIGDFSDMQSTIAVHVADCLVREREPDEQVVAAYGEDVLAQWRERVEDILGTPPVF